MFWWLGGILLTLAALQLLAIRLLRRHDSFDKAATAVNALATATAILFAGYWCNSSARPVRDTAQSRAAAAPGRRPPDPLSCLPIGGFRHDADRNRVAEEGHSSSRSNGFDLSSSEAALTARNVVRIADEIVGDGSTLRILAPADATGDGRVPTLA